MRSGAHVEIELVRSPISPYLKSPPRRPTTIQPVRECVSTWRPCAVWRQQTSTFSKHSQSIWRSEFTRADTSPGSWAVGGRGPGFCGLDGVTRQRAHNHDVPPPGVPAEDIDFLSLLSEVNRRRLLERSTQTVYSAGELAFHPEGHLAPSWSREVWSEPTGAFRTDGKRRSRSFTQTSCSAQPRSSAIRPGRSYRLSLSPH